MPTGGMVLVIVSGILCVGGLGFLGGVEFERRRFLRYVGTEQFRRWYLWEAYEPEAESLPEEK